MEAENAESDFQHCVATVVAICVLVAIVFKLFVYYSRNFNESTSGDLNTDAVFGQCKFPDCIRCRRHKDVLMRARTKLTYFDENNRESTASVATILLKDIQASYRKLTQDVTIHDAQTVDLSEQNPLVFHVRGIRAQPVWDIDEFPGLETLSDNIQQIQKEFWELRQGDTYNANYWKENDTPAGKWSVCHLLDQGVQTKAVTACPATWRIISRLPVAMTDNLFGNIAFSVVEPETRISPHFGPSNIRIRCHLGLQVPEGCQLTVGTASQQWSEGKMVCFDETYLHSVQHRGTCRGGAGLRVILIVDLWHPDLHTEQRNLINYAFSSAAVP